MLVLFKSLFPLDIDDSILCGEVDVFSLLPEGEVILKSGRRRVLAGSGVYNDNEIRNIHFALFQVQQHNGIVGNTTILAI